MKDKDLLSCDVGVTGIAAGSVAASGMQAVVGNVAAGSAFFIVQGLGIQGVFVYVGCAGGATAAAGAAMNAAAEKKKSRIAKIKRPRATARMRIVTDQMVYPHKLSFNLFINLASYVYSYQTFYSNL